MTGCNRAQLGSLGLGRVSTAVLTTYTPNPLPSFLYLLICSVVIRFSRKRGPNFSICLFTLLRTLVFTPLMLYILYLLVCKRLREGRVYKGGCKPLLEKDLRFRAPFRSGFVNRPDGLESGLALSAANFHKTMKPLSEISDRKIWLREC